MSGHGRGRGAYFKAKYGGRGGRGGAPAGNGPYPGSDSPFTSQSQDTSNSLPGHNWNHLQNDLSSINGQEYGGSANWLFPRGIKCLLGRYTHSSPTFTLSVDHVQGDAYAAPSRVRAIMPLDQTGIPNEYLQFDDQRIALCDFITRVAADMIRTKHMGENIANAYRGWSGAKGGAFNINAPGQTILPRTSCMISGADSIELRFTVALPAAGRTILGQQAFQILAINMAELVRHALLWSNLDHAKLEQHILAVKNQRILRQQLQETGLIAFVANGSILPRASGASAGPLVKDQAMPFQSPEDLEISMILSDKTIVRGMGIPRGVTVITGGGYHGKSTLLEALEMGIYDHIPGDGRELVVTDPSAVKIRAEDGRHVAPIDISPFISNLPGGRETHNFTSDDASGSTSMAANIQEALEAGARTLLIDEDSSATNLLVRDSRMQALIQNEPITPLIAKARALAEHHQTSTVIIIGGLGDWLPVADHVIGMDSYRAENLTTKAQAIAAQYPTLVQQIQTYGSIPARQFKLDLSGYRTPYALSKHFISIKTQGLQSAVDDPSQDASGIQLSGLDQLVEIGQARMIAAVLQRISDETGNKAQSLDQLLETLGRIIGTTICLPASLLGGELVAVRGIEVAAVLSRMRAGLSIERT